MKGITLFSLIALYSCIGPAPPSPPSPTPTGPGSPPSPSSSPTTTTAVACPDPPTWGPALGKTVSTERRDAGERQINAAFRGAGYSDGQVLEGDCNRASRIFYLALRNKIRELGTCAYDNDDGKRADAIHVVLPDGHRALDHHLLNFGGCRIRLASSENYKGDWALSPTHPTSSPPPGSSPPTTTPPGTVTAATPSPGGCRLPLEAERLTFGIGLRQQATRFLDASPKYWYVDIDNKPVGPCGRRQCDLGVDGGEDGRLCTELLVGTPQWSTVAGDLVLEPGFQGNPYFARVQSGSGRARVCSERLPKACGEIVVP